MVLQLIAHHEHEKNSNSRYAFVSRTASEIENI